VFIEFFAISIFPASEKRWKILGDNKIDKPVAAKSFLEAKSFTLTLGISERLSIADSLRASIDRYFLMNSPNRKDYF